MSLTKALNSKSNIKQYSSADLPVIPRQPVINRYSAESTASQTVINLPFSIDTVNAPEVLLLSVDGKLLTQGSLNDYTFTAIDGFGFSNQITLTQGIAAGLNIQAIKLGLKKETEFVQDQRFNDVYSSLNEGFQGFVATSSLMTPTSVTGSPASGQFYSSVQNRAPIVNLAQDLKARMGIDRMPTQGIMQLPNEFGPNGEPVYGATNDPLGLIRFVGNWAQSINAQGQAANRPTGTTTDYVEVTFFGTGLNLMANLTGSGYNYVYSVDGGTESGNITATNYATLLSGRNYSNNTTIQVVSGLSLGVHTVKIRFADSGTNFVYGFEFINNSSTVAIQPGVSFVQGKKLSNQSQQLISYNSSLESGSLSTRGGRVVVYQKADGTIAKAATATEASTQYFTSASHINEDVARVFHWREFGAARSDDYSLLDTNAGAKAFALDDAATTLAAPNVVFNAGSVSNGFYLNGTSSFYMTFVGTGLDVEIDATVAPNSTHTFLVDGVTAINAQTLITTATKRIVSVVSGLPYGTHVLKVTRNQANNTFGFTKFIVYQPKKPAVPSGAVELADYNVMADYSANNTANTVDAYSTGTLYKSPTREVNYVGTWGGGVNQTAGTDPGGFTVRTTTNGDYLQTSFFGTGVELMLRGGSGTVTGTIQIDGAAYTGAATTLGASGTWTPGTSTYVASGNSGASLRITGLTLGFHTIRFTATAAANTVNFNGINAIVPIHSYDPNLPYSQQNTMLIGSQSIMDTRKTSAIKESNLQVKNVSQAVGIAISPSTTSTQAIPCPDMSVTHFNRSGKIKISYSINGFNNSGGSTVSFVIYVNGSSVVSPKSVNLLSVNANSSVTTSDSVTVNVAPGVNKVDVYWYVSGGGTGIAAQNFRNLLVEEA